MLSNICEDIALVFDFDGVIIESNEVKTEAFRKVYLSFGENIAHKVVLDHKENQGVSRYEKFKKWHKTFLDINADQKTLDVLSKKFSGFVVNLLNEAPLVEGVEYFLNSFSQVVPMHIASATPQKELETIVKNKNLKRHFKSIHGHPTTKSDVLISLKNMYPNRSVVMIGDAKQDMLAAKTADAVFIARIYPDNSQMFSDVQRIDNFYELPQLLKDIFLKPNE